MGWQKVLAVGIGICIVIAVVGVGPLVGPGVAEGERPPLAEAGLDQTVQRNATVYLDAGGSLDPDGTIQQYRWRIEAPDGTTTTPACPTCVRTHFRARQVGTYEVTVTVTDDSGATATDTLFVEVNAANPPDVSVTGPASLRVGESGTFETSVTAGAEPVSSLSWSVDGSVVDAKFVDGAGSWQRSVSFDDSGTHTVSVRVGDAAGRVVKRTRTVNVERKRSPDSAGTNSGPSSTGSGSHSGGGTTTASFGGTSSAGTPAGIYVNEQGDIVDIVAPDPGNVLTIGGATLTTGTFEKLRNAGGATWNNVQQVLEAQGISKENVVDRAKDGIVSCGDYLQPRVSGCKAGDSVDYGGAGVLDTPDVSVGPNGEILVNTGGSSADGPNGNQTGNSSGGTVEAPINDNGNEEETDSIIGSNSGETSTPGDTQFNRGAITDIGIGGNHEGFSTGEFNSNDDSDTSDSNGGDRNDDKSSNIETGGSSSDSNSGGIGDDSDRSSDSSNTGSVNAGNAWRGAGTGSSFGGGFGF